MADTDLVESLRGYFMETETTHPCNALDEDEYSAFRSLLDQALADNPESAQLWFWQGWGYQFFLEEGEFEWAEDAYERALAFNPEFAPAVLALSYLYWNTAYQRARQAIIDDITHRFEVSPDSVYEDFQVSDIGELFKKADVRARAAVSYEAAQTAWRRLDADLIVEGLNEEADQSGDLLVWYRLFVEMSEDLALSSEELGRIHWNFGYGFFNYLGLSEFDSVVKEAFEAVKRYSGPSRQLADALAYLALSNSERNQESPNPRTAYAFVQQLLDLYQQYQADPAVIRTSAYDSYDGFLRDFYAWNPVFSQNNPGQCIALFERSQHLGLIPTKWPSEVRLWAGHFYYRMGKYEEGIAQFEMAQIQMKGETEFHQDYALSLAKTNRIGEAIGFLDETNNTQHNDHVETVLFLLREIQAQNDSREELVQTFGQELLKTPKFPTETEIESECRRNWPDYWIAFPESLRRMIVTAEYANRFVTDASLWDFSMLGAQWGKIAEVAYSSAILVPLSSFAEINGVAEVKALLQNGSSKLLARSDLTTKRSRNVDQALYIGLLRAARDDSSHPVAEMLRKLNLDPGLWFNRISMQLDTIRRMRNEHAHGVRIAGTEDVDQLRSILVTEGLLANLGQAMLYAQNVHW